MEKSIESQVKFKAFEDDSTINELTKDEDTQTTQLMSNSNSTGNGNIHDSIFKSMEGFIGKSYSKIGEEVIKIWLFIYLQIFSSHLKEFKKILNNREVPDLGLEASTIKYIVSYISLMDSNNGPNHIGIGEREGRVKSKIVQERHFSLIHGMGR